MNKEWVETAMKLADEYASLHYNSADHIELQARAALEAHLNTSNPDQAKRGGNTAGGSCSTTGTGWGQGARGYRLAREADGELVLQGGGGGGGTGYTVRSGYVTGSASAGTVAEDQAVQPSHAAASLIQRLQACLDDPMWADHAEISKSTLKDAIAALQKPGELL